jgi:hypothetical protein
MGENMGEPSVKQKKEDLETLIRTKYSIFALYEVPDDESPTQRDEIEGIDAGKHVENLLAGLRKDETLILVVRVAN